jgi:hypothetical protein
MLLEEAQMEHSRLGAGPFGAFLTAFLSSALDSSAALVLEPPLAFRGSWRVRLTTCASAGVSRGSADAGGLLSIMIGFRPVPSSLAGGW